jgi:small subunit ribosomal protein S19e
MTTVYDVPAEPAIMKVAELLKKEKAIQPPEWAPFVKTGGHREKPPEDPEWWYVRLAAVLRKVAMQGPIGSERLSSLYGGAKDRGSKPDRAISGSGSIARKALQQLEAAGLVVNIKGRGRTVTPQGRKLLDNAAHTVKQELLKTYPALAKY